MTAVDLVRAIANYRDALRLPTISRIGDDGVDWEPFDRLQELLLERYPALHGALERVETGTRGILMRWPGSTGGAPTVLMAHYDVVAVGGDWTTEPFSAVVVDGADGPVVRARGAIDDKASLVGILEAVETLAETGFVPESDIYLAFSHNEEVLGDSTPSIVAALAARGVRPRMVLDEGGIVGESIFPGAPDSTVQVGVSEKGTATIRLTCTAAGGHASVPPRETVTARLARAIVRIDDAGQQPFVNDVTRRLVRDLGPVSTGVLAEAAALLATDEEGFIDTFSTVSADARAMVHSSAAVTVVTAGHTANAVPEEATALVNLRISVGDTVAAAIDRLRAAINDPEVRLDVVEAGEASPVSPSSGPEWELLVEEIGRTYGEHVLVSPYVNNGGTDSRNYTSICDTVYRFSPCVMTLEERRSIHAIDEHLRLKSFTDGCGFYFNLIARL